MRNFKKYKKFSSFLRFIRRSAKFSFRIGVFNDDRFSFNGSGNFFYHFFPDVAPKKPNTITTPLGKLGHRSLVLEPNSLFEDPQPFARQGDIFVYSDQMPAAVGSATHWVLASQTCTTEQDVISLMLPAYDRTQFLNSISALRNVSGSPDSFYQNEARQNKVSRFLPLPPQDAWGDSNLIVDLYQLYSVQSAIVKNQRPIRSLTFAGLSYFQARLAMTLFRDVKNWDENRSL